LLEQLGRDAETERIGLRNCDAVVEQDQCGGRSFAPTGQSAHVRRRGLRATANPPFQIRAGAISPAEQLENNRLSGDGYIVQS
jgi:hypothetical protein